MGIVFKSKICIELKFIGTMPPSFGQKDSLGDGVGGGFIR